MRFRIISFFMAVVFASPAFAGTEVGNGGLGVLLPAPGGQQILRLLDFAENGVNTASFANPRHETPMIARVVTDRLTGALSFSPSALAVMSMVSAKLSEIADRDSFLGTALLELLQTLEWRAVQTDLVPTNDLGPSPISFPEGNIRQLATRMKDVVRLDARLLSTMPADDVAGLVLHELIYALISVDDEASAARSTREIVGYIFSGGSQNGFANLFSIAKNSLPSIDRVDSINWFRGKTVGVMHLGRGDYPILRLRLGRLFLSIDGGAHEQQILFDPLDAGQIETVVSHMCSTWHAGGASASAGDALITMRTPDSMRGSMNRIESNLEHVRDTRYYFSYASVSTEFEPLKADRLPLGEAACKQVLSPLLTVYLQKFFDSFLYSEIRD